MRMEFLKQNILELGKYFQTNCIEIDKSTYFTVIIGQITIYGILVTFYQFVVSYNGNNELVKKYLGVNVVEYYVKKKVVVFDKFISKRIFSFLFILEILYKPVSVLLGNKIDKCIYYMLNSVWYTISVLYFIVFTIMLKEFISCTLTIKNFSNINQNICLKKDIDNLRFKNSIKDKIYMENIELLIRKFECLFIYIKEDNNDTIEIYYDVIKTMLDNYVDNKKNGSTLFYKYMYRVIKKDRRDWIIDSNKEIYLLNEILNNKRILESKKILICIYNIYISLIDLNLKYAEIDDYKYIQDDNYFNEYNNENILDVSEWKNFLYNIYINSDDNIKKYIIKRLFRNINNSNKLYQQYYNRCIYELARYEINNIFNGRRQEKSFLDVFGDIIGQEKVNYYCAKIIGNNLLQYNKINIIKDVNYLSELNCTYLFAYIMLYYSLYKNRYNQMYLDINILKILWRHHGDFKDKNNIIKQLKDSNIGHRIDDNIYNRFIEYMYEKNEKMIFAKSRNESTLDMFCIWTMKICVINNEIPMYSLYKLEDYKKYEHEIIKLINEISKHNELLENDNIKQWIYNVRYNFFNREKEIPQNLLIELRTLLLSNINIDAVLKKINDTNILYYNDFGKYLLVKIDDIPSQIKQQDRVKETIKKAFTMSNMDIETFLNELVKESEICGCEIDYYQKEIMRSFLLNVD